MLIPTRTLLGCLSARFSAAICYSGGAPRLLHEDKILSCVPVYFKRNSLPPCSLSRESVAVSTRWRNFNCRVLAKAPKQSSGLMYLCRFAPSWFSRASFLCCGTLSRPPAAATHSSPAGWNLQQAGTWLDSPRSPTVSAHWEHEGWLP